MDSQQFNQPDELHGPAMFFLEQYAATCACVYDEQLPTIATMVNMLADVRDLGGRVFFVGTGGGAANAIHAAADFRQLCNIQTFTPWDNPAYMSARINDGGWTTSYRDWLESFPGACEVTAGSPS